MDYMKDPNWYEMKNGDNVIEALMFNYTLEQLKMLWEYEEERYRYQNVIDNENEEMSDLVYWAYQHKKDEEEKKQEKK